MHEERRIELHVVAQIVEAELVIRAIADVAAISLLSLRVGHVVLDDADGETEELEELAHPIRVAPGKIVVDGDDVNTLARERVQVDRERCDESLALARFHLSDATFVEHNPTDELHVEMTHLQNTPARLAAHGKDLGQELVERLPFFTALFELGGLRFELVVREFLDGRLKLVDDIDDRPHAFELAPRAASENLGENGVDDRHN